MLRGPRRFNPGTIFPSSLNTYCASDPQLWHRFRNVSVRLNIVVALFWPCNLLKLYVSRFHKIAVVSLRAQNIAVAPVALAALWLALWLVPAFFLRAASNLWQVVCWVLG